MAAAALRLPCARGWAVANELYNRDIVDLVVVTAEPCGLCLDAAWDYLVTLLYWLFVALPCFGGRGHHPEL